MARPSVSRALVGAVALLTGTAGCRASEPAGGTGLEGPDAALDWAVEPVARVGGADATDETAFGEVAGVAFDAVGRLFVLDADARRVVVLDTTGAVLATRGAPGDGPGELASAAGLVVDAEGSVTVLDAARRRFVTYRPDGAPGSTVEVPDSLALPAGPLASDARGGVLGTDQTGLVEPGVVPPPSRSLLVHPTRPGGEARIGWRGWRPATPSGRPLTDDETGGMRVRLAPLVGFHPRILSAPLPDGRIAVVDSLDWAVRIVRLDGSTERRLVRPVEPRAVTEAIRDAERARRVAELDADAPRMVRSDADGVRTAVADDAVGRLQEARIDAMGFHEVIPVIDAIRVDALGRLWIARTPVPPATRGAVDVVTPAGAYLGTLPAGRPGLPAAFGPHDLVAFVGRDDFGAPVIHIGRLLENDP